MADARTRRLAERIAVIVAELLERRIKDPRLGFVTVTEVRLTADHREAKVFYTVLGSAEERQETALALRSATGIIRSEVGRQLGLRHTPSLAFIADVLPENAQRIEEQAQRLGRLHRRGGRVETAQVDVELAAGEPLGHLVAEPDGERGLPGSRGAGEDHDRDRLA